MNEYIKRNYPAELNSKKEFISLSFTWGLPLTLIGAGVALALSLKGYKPTPLGHGMCFEVGENWGGLNLGYFSFVCKNSQPRTRSHEYGHALQNCVYGFSTPFIVTIPSAIRYWYRVYRYKIGDPVKTPYDTIWFEHQATEWGNQAINNK